MKKFFTLLAKKMIAAIRPTTVTENVTAPCYTTGTTNIIHHNYKNDPAHEGSFFFSKNDQHLRVNNDLALCNATTTNDKTKAHNDHDPARAGSFSFSPAAAIYSGAASAKKESYYIRLAKRFLFSNKTYKIRSAEYNKLQLPMQLTAVPIAIGTKKNFYDGNKL
jgi:hypothetical protein